MMRLQRQRQDAFSRSSVCAPVVWALHRRVLHLDQIHARKAATRHAAEIEAEAHRLCTQVETHIVVLRPFHVSKVLNEVAARVACHAHTVASHLESAVIGGPASIRMRSISAAQRPVPAGVRSVNWVGSTLRRVASTAPGCAPSYMLIPAWAWPRRHAAQLSARRQSVRARQESNLASPR